MLKKLQFKSLFQLKEQYISEDKSRKKLSINQEILWHLLRIFIKQNLEKKLLKEMNETGFISCSEGI
jgi:uncharacterized protein (DUF488 family)